MWEIREQLRAAAAVGGGSDDSPPPDPFQSSDDGFGKVPYWDFSYPRPATANMEFLD